MTESNPTPDQIVPTTSPDHPDAPDLPDTSAPETGEAGYAVYDETLLRFIGGVHEKKADAEKVKKSGPSGHKLKVQKV